MIQRVVKLSKGNPGAINVLMSTLSQFPEPFLCDLFLGVCERYGLEGSVLWVLYKDVCWGSIPTFKVSVSSENVEDFDRAKELCR